MVWKRTLAACVAVAIAAFAVVGCGGDSGTNSTTNGDFSITVGSGTRPTYTWSAGDAFSLSVVRTAAPTTIVWGLATMANAENIASPVNHGTVGSIASGTVNTATTEQALTAGVEYRVTVTRLDGKTGWTEFTP
jgi:hypothetical protein